MNALLEAKKLYEEQGVNFERELGFYLTNGLVIVRPDRFLMAKMIRLEEGENSWNSKDPDCWYVACAIGKGCLEWFLMQAPLRLHKLAWKRFKDKGQRLRVYNTDQFERLN
jgi:hypothetical protein